MSQLTLEQRFTTSVMNNQDYKQKDISIAIGRDKSVIRRELSRNCDQRNSKYDYNLAQRKFSYRQKHKPRTIKFTKQVKHYVDKKLSEKWSPEQISKAPGTFGLEMVSNERIYQYIIADKKKGGDKYKHLRRRKKHKGDL